DRAGDARRSADHGEDQDLDRAGEPEVAGLDGKVEMRGEAAGPRRDRGAGDERGELVATDRDALARGRDLVLTDRGPGAPDGRALHAPQHVGHDGEAAIE